MRCAPCDAVRGVRPAAWEDRYGYPSAGGALRVLVDAMCLFERPIERGPEYPAAPCPPINSDQRNQNAKHSSGFRSASHPTLDRFFPARRPAPGTIPTPAVPTPAPRQTVPYPRHAPVSGMRPARRTAHGARRRAPAKASATAPASLPRCAHVRIAAATRSLPHVHVVTETRRSGTAACLAGPRDAKQARVGMARGR